MAIALREFFFPIEKPIPERKPSPYPEPRKPVGAPLPPTEAEAAAMAAKIIFGPINWIEDQRAIDRRAKAWKQVSFGGRFGQDPSGEDYTLDLRGGWRQFLTHPVKTVKKAAKSLVIRKVYDAMQTSALRHYHDLWQMGKLSQSEYIKFAGQVNKTLEWIGPRDWQKIYNSKKKIWEPVSTTLTKGSGKLWERLEFIDNPIGYTMREYVWKKGVRPAIKKITSPITTPIRNFINTKIKAPLKAGIKKRILTPLKTKIIDPAKAWVRSKITGPIKTKIADPLKEKIKQAVRKVWEKIKEKAKEFVKKYVSEKVRQTVSRAVKKVTEAVSKKVGQAAATLLRRGVEAAGRVVFTLATKAVVFVGSAVSSLATAAASAVSAPAIAIIAVVVILLLIVLALITTVGTHSAFLPPNFGGPLPGEQFVQMRKLIYHETTAGVGVNPLKIPLGALPNVNFEIAYRNVSEEMLTNVRVVDNYNEGALDVTAVDNAGIDDSDKIVWDIGDLDVDEARTVFYSTTLNTTASDQVIFNNVTLTATTEDGTAVNVSAQGVVIVGNPSGQPPSGWPVDHGCISQGFNVTTDPDASHYGVDAIDIAGVTNQAILATHDGVAYIGETARAGKYVRVTSDVSGFSTFYCHLETRAVATGDVVVPGQLLGGMGNTGHTDGGVHVHYEVEKDGTLVTIQYIPDNSFDGCIDTQVAGGNCNCCFTGRNARCGE